MDEKKLVTLYVDHEFEKEAEAVDVESEPTISPCNETAHFTGTPVEAGTLFFPVPMFFIDCENGYVWQSDKEENTEFSTNDKVAYCFKSIKELEEALKTIQNDKSKKEKFGDWLLVYKFIVYPLQNGECEGKHLEPFRIILLEERAPYGL